MHVANTKKSTTTTTRRRWRRRARIAAAVEPFFCLWFSLVFLCLACTFAKCRTQVATVAASRASSSSSSSYTRGCENSSLAFQKLNCIFPKKGTGNTRRALHEHGVGDWFEQSENQIIGIYFSFWLCHPPLLQPACLLAAWGSSNWTTEASNALWLPNCGSKVGSCGGHHVPGWGCLMLALLMPPN